MMVRLLGTGRPLFYTDWPDAKLESTPHYTVGTLMRALKDGETLPSTEALLVMNLETFGKYDLEKTVPEDPHGWGYDVQKDYARPWGELGKRFEEEGNVEKAQGCYAMAATWAPWLVKVR
jgi:hypothetical protein